MPRPPTSPRDAADRTRITRRRDVPDGGLAVTLALGILVIEARKQTALLKRLVEHAYGHEAGYLDD